MARRKTLPESLRAKLDLAERLALLRLELFGERGGPEMARRLGIPVRTWYNYEGGVTVPAEVVLKIIELTSVEPTWLLRGKGPKFRPAGRDDRSDGPPTMMVGALLRTALQLLEGEASPELGTATARFLESEKSLVDSTDDDEDDEDDDKEISSHRGGPDELRAGRGEREWLEARREGRCLTVPDAAMEPVLPRGAMVAYTSEEESARELDGRMVAAWIDGQPMVRWFQDLGDHGLLRAQDPAERPFQVNLDDELPRIRRILWIEAVR
ncbi:S24 family peptidase [Paludisphaera rhizosphaerae]|uniref:S24 family peptidase n=1 Tax=Paludisphaera rhizosphaerae TaxID=2711216 RepID=UPI0013EC178E|nr:S24 family peptidase [Paludisphaera rhizosphaerae]